MKPDKQFKRAQELGAIFTLRLEDSASALRLRNLRDRSELVLPVEQAIEQLKQQQTIANKQEKTAREPDRLQQQ